MALPTLEYSGQSSAELIAHHGSHDTRSILCALEWAIQAKGRNRLGKLSPEERTVLSILALDREVNNGGFDQFFVNSSRKYVPAIVADLEAIGAGNTAKLVANAISARRDAAALDQLDQEYYDGHSMGIEANLWTFIERHQAAIQVPAIPSERGASSPVPDALPAFHSTAEDELKKRCQAVGALVLTGKMDDALTLARELVDAHPQTSSCWRELALVLARRGELGPALEANEQAIACDPGDYYLLSTACRITARNEAWDACFDYSERGSRMEVPHSIRRMMRDEFGLWGARALHALGRHQEAIDRLAPLPPVDFYAGSKLDPLLDPRRLAKACREAIGKRR